MNETMPAPVEDALAAAKKELAKLGGCALLIGVETYDGLPEDKQLHAGRNDAMSYWRVCRRLGYRPEHIRVLTSPQLTRDDLLRAELDLALELHATKGAAEIAALVDGWLAGEQPKVVLGEATREALIDGVKWLAAKLVFTVKLGWEGFQLEQELASLPGLLAYSGHGAQVADDLALCPRDVGSGLEQAVRFAELRALIDAGDDLRAAGTPRPADNLTVVLDCCFAAAVEESKSLRVPTLTPPETDHAPVAKVEIGSRVFCASGRAEQAWQAMLGGRWQGAFTWAFTRALEQWQTAPASGQFKQFKQSTVSHMELLFRSRMLLEALSFPQHPMLVDSLGNLPVFQHDSNMEAAPSAEPTAARQGAQIDPSTGFAAYEISDDQGNLLAQVVATKTAGLGMKAAREYWKIIGPSFQSLGYEAPLSVKKVHGGGWGTSPPFDASQASFWCPVNKPWAPNSTARSYHRQTASAGTWGGFEVDVSQIPGGWQGSMKFYRDSAQGLLFANLPVGETRELQKVTYTPAQQCLIINSDINSRLYSGNIYYLYDLTRARYIHNPNSSWATTDQGARQLHTLTRKAGDGPITSGDEIYIQATASAVNGYYLRSGNPSASNDLWYQDVTDPVDVHTWIIQKENHVQGAVIWPGDSITLKSKAQQRYMEANTGDAYLSTMDGARLWRVSR